MKTARPDRVPRLLASLALLVAVGSLILSYLSFRSSQSVLERMDDHDRRMPPVTPAATVLAPRFTLALPLPAARADASADARFQAPRDDEPTRLRADGPLVPVAGTKP